MKRTLGISITALLLGAFCAVAIASGPEVKEGNVTFAKDVAPIFNNNCVGCHRPGEIAPMSLLSYKDARPWAKSIKEKVATGVMPPWHADPHYGAFENDRRLSQKDIDTIVAWVDQGAKEGNPKDLPPTRQFADGWNIDKPDVVFYLPQEFTVPASGVVEYKYFKVPTNFKQDVYIQAAEIRPGERSVVHHIIVFSQSAKEPQRLIAGYAPGEQPAVISKGLARKIPAGSDLIFQVHYTPTGSETKDKSYVGFVFSKEPPKAEIMTRPIMNARFAIPPGDPNYRVESTYTFTQDSHVYSLMPHMHLRGKDFEFRAVFPDGTSRVLLSVPKYDFAWQTYYVLKEPLAAPKGTRIDCLAHFDNSEKNKFNPDPKKEVRWGDQTWEEMMIGWMSYTVDAPQGKPDTLGQNK